MSPAEARALIAHPSLTAGGPQTWADLGSGDGTFTAALASQLQDGSVVHAMDIDARAVSDVDAPRPGVAIITHVGDFTEFPWPFTDLDGMLMANSLHYVEDQRAFLRNAVSQLRRKRLLLVEYDTTSANAWVPYPVSYASATALAADVGLRSITPLKRRRSVYRRAEIYAVLLE